MSDWHTFTPKPRNTSSSGCPKKDRSCGALPATGESVNARQSESGQHEADHEWFDGEMDGRLTFNSVVDSDQ
eukprot:3502210-Pyramimonas_sp.AAC.1